MVGVVPFGPQRTLLPGLYPALSVTLSGFVYRRSVTGLVYYRESPTVAALLLLLTPLVVLVHSVGALYGLAAPADGGPGGDPPRES